MNSERSGERVQLALTRSPTSNSGIAFETVDAICKYTACLYVQRHAQLSQMNERDRNVREDDSRRLFLQQVNESLQKRFDCLVDSLESASPSDIRHFCATLQKQNSEASNVQPTKLGGLAKLQRLFKRSHTSCDSAEASKRWSTALNSSSNAPSSIEDTASSSGNTGSSVWSSDATRVSVLKEGEVELCVTDASTLPRGKRLKFARALAVLRRDERTRNYIVEFCPPVSSASASFAQRRTPKYGLLCRHIDTLRPTTRYEPPKDRAALLLKVRQVILSEFFPRAFLLSCSVSAYSTELQMLFPTQ